MNVFFALKNFLDSIYNSLLTVLKVCNILQVRNFVLFLPALNVSEMFQFVFRFY